MDSISSRTNERVKSIVRLENDASARRSQGLCVALGYKLCMEAARLGAVIEEVWMTSDMLELNRADADELIRESLETVIMNESVCQKLAEQRTPQGVLALVRIPEATTLQELARAERAVALCSVQDPANVGAALRTAAALGYRAAVTADCADPYSPKSLRASMGAAFAARPAVFDDGVEMTAALKSAGFTTLAATLSPDADELGGCEPPERPAVVIGSEGRGLPPEVAAACDRALTIPIDGAVESLNAAAAAAVIMWELRR